MKEEEERKEVCERKNLPFSICIWKKYSQMNLKYKSPLLLANNSWLNIKRDSI